MSVPTRLGSTEDAIRLAEVALGTERLVAIIDGDAKLVMPVSGDIPPDGVLRVAAVLRGAFADGTADARLVLVTRRTTGPSMVLEDELALWRHLCAEHAHHPLPLADWLVFVRDEVVLSLAELAGPRAVWS
jgi:hypothetical protein